jgi:asparagine synthase (glutamine-hydrolysing)
MFRYLIAVGNPQSASDCEILSGIRRHIELSRGGWRTLYRPGFYAAHIENDNSRDAPVLLHDDRGIIFGSLYRCPKASRSDIADSGSLTRVSLISRERSERILESRGRSMITDYWGNYVVALRYPEAKRSLVLRGPVSPLACQHLRLGTLDLFFSHVEDCIALNLSDISINWDSIIAQVVGGDYVTGETALEQIRRIECGECIECAPEDCIAHNYWDPRFLLADRSLDNFVEATAIVRDSAQYCANATSSSHGHMLVNLSGGLDSSIVLSMLGAAPHRPKLTAINRFSSGCGDERHFARIMAKAVGCHLIEQPRDAALDLRRIDECNWTVSPVLNFSAPDIETRNITLAREIGASAIVDGELGDNLFGSNIGVGALVECFRRHHFQREFRTAAVDYAMVSRQSLWRTLARVVGECTTLTAQPDFSATHELQHRYSGASARTMILASADAEEHYASSGKRFLHPWLQSSRRIAPGSHMLLFGLIMTTSTVYHSPFARPSDPPQLSPFLCQPLLEVALRISAHLHVRNGLNRAVARAAFADRLPTPILQRGMAKGGPHLWAKHVVEHNVTFVREYLMDGILVQRGLIDRSKLEAVVSPRIERSTAIVGDIFAKLYIEAWLRKWQQLPSRRNNWPAARSP